MIHGGVTFASETYYEHGKAKHVCRSTNTKKWIRQIANHVNTGDLKIMSEKYSVILGPAVLMKHMIVSMLKSSLGTVTQYGARKIFFSDPKLHSD